MLISLTRSCRISFTISYHIHFHRKEKFSGNFPDRQQVRSRRSTRRAIRGGKSLRRRERSDVPGVLCEDGRKRRRLLPGNRQENLPEHHGRQSRSQRCGYRFDSNILQVKNEENQIDNLETLSYAKYCGKRTAPYHPQSRFIWLKGLSFPNSYQIYFPRIDDMNGYLEKNSKLKQ